jgi:uncharacterized membrane protein YcaP (DUF421 family)
MGIILGSVFSRAINGPAPFFATIMAGLVLVLVHWLFAAAAFQSTSWGSLIKGESDILIKNGEIQWKHMRKHDVTEKDLKVSLRLTSKTDNLTQVKLAILERNGNISFQQQEKQPKVIELDVREGVQRIRSEIQT